MACVVGNYSNTRITREWLSYVASKLPYAPMLNEMFRRDDSFLAALLQCRTRRNCQSTDLSYFIKIRFRCQSNCWTYPVESIDIWEIPPKMVHVQNQSWFFDTFSLTPHLAVEHGSMFGWGHVIMAPQKKPGWARIWNRMNTYVLAFVERLKK